MVRNFSTTLSCLDDNMKPLCGFVLAVLNICTTIGHSSPVILYPGTPPPPPDLDTLFSMENQLNHIVDVMQQNPNMRVEVQGHTDHVGTTEYNQKLSERRADTVMQYLIDKGIAADRLTAVGYGENYPTADNKTKEGRARNRRVQLKPME